MFNLIFNLHVTSHVGTKHCKLFVEIPCFIALLNEFIYMSVRSNTCLHVLFVGRCLHNCITFSCLTKLNRCVPFTIQSYPILSNHFHTILHCHDPILNLTLPYHTLTLPPILTTSLLLPCLLGHDLTLSYSNLLGYLCPSLPYHPHLYSNLPWRVLRLNIIDLT